MDQDQLDRIERKLDEVLAFRDLLLKFAMPRIPAAMRTRAAQVMAKGQRP
jgi:hypothetical protein